MDALNITLAQINPIVGDLPFNLELIRDIWNKNDENAQLIIFPEMALCGYPPEDLVLKPSFLDMIEASIHKLADESKNKNSFLLIPTPFRNEDALYNAALLIGDGKYQIAALKKHLPNYGVFDEQRLFTPSTAPSPLAFKGLKLGVMVCEDMWFSDVALDLKEKDADILISVNASPFELGKQDKRISMATSRVKETSLPLIYLNQCGGQDELVFDGSSFVLDENANICVQAKAFEQQAISTVWYKEDSGLVCKTNDKVEALRGDEQIYTALMCGLKDYVSKNNFKGVIIGLSGGVDSALSAALAVDALGAERVECVMMPSKYTSDESLEDAQSCSKLLGCAYKEISIESAVDAFENELTKYFDENTPSTTFENIQPRARALILMALSNASGKMVLSTGNKSEMAVGYATLYGDMCGGFNALKDVYKTQVYSLCKWRNQNKPALGLGPTKDVIPERIITKAPSAELKDNQTDQDSLPEYKDLDDVLTCLIEKEMSLKEIIKKGYKASMVKKIWQLLDVAEYKRRQAPPGVKITRRAFGRDRRYPITNHFTKLLDSYLGED